jgi:hypothetical protein
MLKRTGFLPGIVLGMMLAVTYSQGGGAMEITSGAFKDQG